MDCVYYGEDCKPNSLEDCDKCEFYKSEWTKCPIHGTKHHVTKPCPECLREDERVPVTA